MLQFKIMLDSKVEKKIVKQKRIDNRHALS